MLLRMLTNLIVYLLPGPLAYLHLSDWISADDWPGINDQFIAASEFLFVGKPLLFRELLRAWQYWWEGLAGWND